MNREPDDVRNSDMNSGPTADRARIERLLLRYAGAALLAATAAIHLDLYLTGYNSIPTIGVLFLFQIIAAFLLAIAVAATGSRIAAVSGAGFAISTLGGYLLTVWFGLFGFKEVRTTAGIVAAVIEIAAFVVLAGLALMPALASEKRAGLVPWQAARPGAGRRARRRRGDRSGGADRAARHRLLPRRGRRQLVDPGRQRLRAENHDHQGRDGTHELQGLHLVLVRAGFSRPSPSATARAPPTGRRSRRRSRPAQA